VRIAVGAVAGGVALGVAVAATKAHHKKTAMEKRRTA